jgi:hypothetical protein
LNLSNIALFILFHDTFIKDRRVVAVGQVMNGEEVILNPEEPVDRSHRWLSGVDQPWVHC